jgi:carboxyl-terminal processing protease
LPDNTGLALTTQHYYTPSGRLIQRDYSNISFLDYYYGKHVAEKDPNDVKHTDLGRTVYGGGGITPDEKYDMPKLNPFQVAIVRKNAFFTYSTDYFSNHDTKLPKGWAPDESVLEGFHDYLMKQGVKFTEADWTKDHDWIRNQMQAEMYITAFSYEDYQRLLVEHDPEVTLAIAAMPKASQLMAESKAHSEKQRASLQ